MCQRGRHIFSAAQLLAGSMVYGLRKCLPAGVISLAGTSLKDADYHGDDGLRLASERVGHVGKAQLAGGAGFRKIGKNLT